MSEFLLSPERCAWHRQPGERRGAFQAFALYRDLGDRRSVREVATRVGKAVGTITAYKSEFKWEERISQYEKHLDDKKLQHAEKQIQEMAERHATIACMFQQKVMDRLMTLTDADLKAMSHDTLMSWFVQSAKMESSARGLPDTHIKAEHEHSGPDKGPIQVEFLETVVRTRKEVDAIIVRPDAPLLTSND